MEPTILFLRRHPVALEDSVALASSMQSLETSFFLIALGRFPHALSTCAAAIETAIQASDAGATDRDGLQKLMRKAIAKSQAIDQFSEEQLRRFRETRNRIVHHGFSPRDDSEASSLLLEVGFPLLVLCYSELHSFDARAGLLPQLSEQMDVATRVHSFAKERSGLDLSYCLNGFGHLVRWCFKGNFSSRWEINALTNAEETGWAHEQTTKERDSLASLFDVYWLFDCPICDGIETVVCEIDSHMLETFKVVPLRMACTSCGFVVRESHPFLSEILMEQQVADARPRILKEYGVQ